MSLSPTERSSSSQRDVERYGKNNDPKRSKQLLIRAINNLFAILGVAATNVLTLQEIIESIKRAADELEEISEQELDSLPEPLRSKVEKYVAVARAAQEVEATDSQLADAIHTYIRELKRSNGSSFYAAGRVVLSGDEGELKESHRMILLRFAALARGMLKKAIYAVEHGRARNKMELAKAMNTQLQYCERQVDFFGKMLTSDERSAYDKHYADSMPKPRRGRNVELSPPKLRELTKRDPERTRALNVAQENYDSLVAKMKEMESEFNLLADKLEAIEDDDEHDRMLPEVVAKKDALMKFYKEHVEPAGKELNRLKAAK